MLDIFLQNEIFDGVLTNGTGGNNFTKYGNCRHFYIVLQAFLQ